MSADLHCWIPGRGPEPDAIERMRRVFRKPAQAMGEAWFMGAERFKFERFAELPVAEIPLAELGRFLFEITSGTSAFGASSEWSSWLSYALPDLILRSHESHAFQTLLEPTISAFMSVHGSVEQADGYPQFEHDINATLGRCLMKPELWLDACTPRLGKILGIRGRSSDVVFWGATSGDFSAAMFFALRYFPIAALPTFLDSVLALEHPAWRARLVTWLWGSARLLRAPDTPLSACQPPIEWENSHCMTIGGSRSEPLLSPARSERVLEHFRTRLEPLLGEMSFAESPEIADVMRSLDAPGALFDALY